jgi:hypothetical protein
MTGSGKISATGKLLLVLLVSGMISCTKNSSTNLQPDLNVANDLVLIQRPLVNIFRVLSMSVTDSLLQQTHIAGIYGATVIYSPALNKYMFSYKGNYCPDSTIRSGRFYAVLSGPFSSPGTTIVITYNNYTEDLHYFYGTDTITCTGVSGGIATYSFIETEDSITKDTGRMIRFSLNQTLELAGDVQSGQGNFSMTGGVTGISSDGHPFTATISDPLTVSYSCPWISTGEINFLVSGAEVPDGFITFPSGLQCSDRVNYNFNGVIYQWRMLEGYLVK